jgi:cytochrome c5
MRNRIFLLLSPATAFAQDAASLYKQNCASCHDGGMDRAPSRDAVHAMSADRVLAAVETGPMIFNGQPPHVLLAFSVDGR